MRPISAKRADRRSGSSWLPLLLSTLLVTAIVLAEADPGRAARAGLELLAAAGAACTVLALVAAGAHRRCRGYLRDYLRYRVTRAGCPVVSRAEALGRLEVRSCWEVAGPDAGISELPR